MWQHLYAPFQSSRSHSISQRREAVQVQVARVRQGLCTTARLQATRGAASQHSAVHVRRMSKDLCAHGCSEPAFAF
ncbi:hypothetical protein RSAG8_00991, partial [Rhizoctonia solani AG-8 WAC10335]